MKIIIFGRFEQIFSVKTWKNAKNNALLFSKINFVILTKVRGDRFMPHQFK